MNILKTLGIALMFPLASLIAFAQSRGPESTKILFDTARESSVSANPLLIIAIIGTIAIILSWKKLKKENQKAIVVGVAVVWVIYFVLSVTAPAKESIPLAESEDWQTDYDFSRMESGIKNKNLVETSYYDYSSAAIKTVANEIASTTTSPEEATQKTLDYVFDNVNYDIRESDGACFDGKASTILKSGIGQCDTQSITVIAILRGMGIAARPVGGCIARNPSCSLQFSLLQSFGKELIEPQFTPLEIGDVDPDAETFSRTIDSKRKAFSRLGGLHAWAQVWLPEKGWVVLEPTAGAFGDTDCYLYHAELFPENDDKEHICVSDNYKYALACSADDFDTMDEEGYGILK